MAAERLPGGATDQHSASETLTFLFTDIEGSTKLIQRLGDDYAGVLERHRAIIRQAVIPAGGTEVDTQGDSFFFVFRAPSQALLGASTAQQALARHPWPEGNEVRVRMGLHTGEAIVMGTTFVGLDVHRAARVAAAAHGGQILLTDATRAILQDRLPEGMTFKDLGLHGLKDLPSPENLFQLVVPGLPSAFPPARALHERKHNLPVDVTSFVGRQREIAGVRRLLGECRLLTLSGPGGTGKTRLAIQAARGVLGDFTDGVFVVRLAPVRDPALIPMTISDAIGLASTSDRPVADALKEHLERRTMLIILDNFEHLLAGSSFVGELLHASVGLKILVTSRARLHLSGEQELHVPPMGLPEPGVFLGHEDFSRYDALALFMQRALATDPAFTVDGDFSVVTDICTMLDGLPLAIELAAARLNLFTPHLLRDRLKHRLPLLTAGPCDAIDHQRTLRTTIGWSYDLLDPTHQALFRRLAVFSGGCTLSAIETVIGGDGIDVVDGLSALIENSLVRRVVEFTHEPRFRMLVTIREFAHESLAESGEVDELECCHARYYMELAERAESFLTGKDPSSVALGLRAEQDNLRAALGRCLRKGDAETGLRIGSAMWRFWQQQGELVEGRRWMAQLLDLPEAAERCPWRAKAMCAIAGMAYWQGDYDEASLDYAESLDVWRELGDRRGTAEVLMSLGYLAGIRGDYYDAHALHEQSRAISIELGDLCSVAQDLVGDGMIYHVEGDRTTAKARFEEACELFEQLGERYGLASALCLLSRILVERGDRDAAHEHWCRAFQLLRELRDGSGMIIALSDLSAIVLARGRAEHAVRLAGAADGLSQTLKIRPPTALTKPPDPRPAASRDIGKEAADSAWESGRTMTLAQAIAYASEITGLNENATATPPA